MSTTSQSKPNRTPRGPRGNLLLGVMPEYNKDALGFITRCARDYGDFVRARFLYVNACFVNHRDYIEEILATNNRNFIKAMSLRSPFFHRLVGNGLVTSEGDFWRRQRRLAQPAFHRERIAAYARVMVDYANRMVASWKQGEVRDVHLDMIRLTQNIVVRTLFSTELYADASKIISILDVLIRPFSAQATLGWILDNRLPTPGNRRFYKAVQQLDQIIYRIINERRADRDKRDNGDLLSMLLSAQDEDGSHMTDKQLRDEVTTLFLAGYETTALTLSYAWYLLSEHPEVEARLESELVEVLDGRPPTMADIPRLVYTEKVIKESMRLYPPAYAVGREAIQGCEIGGYTVRAGTQLFMFQWVVQRDERYFEDPLKFNPDRWTEDFSKKLHRYAYFPFGGGPRLCIGNTFAMMEAVLLLSSIAQRFRLKLAEGASLELLPALSLRPKNGIKMMIQRRE